MVTILKYISFIAISVIGLWYFLHIDGCTRIEKIIVRDSVIVPVILPAITIHDTTRIIRKIEIPIVGDTSAFRVLLVQMDTLRAQLRRAQVRSTFALDTVTSTNDTLHIECDEINRAILAQLNFAQRKVSVKIDKEIIIQKVTPSFSIGIGCGYGIMPSGVQTPILSINFQYNLFTF